jgi:hypothetical protein
MRDFGHYNMKGKRYWPLQHGRWKILAYTTWNVRDINPYSMDGKKYWSLSNGMWEILIIISWKVKDTGPYNMERERYWPFYHRMWEILALTTWRVRDSVSGRIDPGLNPEAWAKPSIFIHYRKCGGGGSFAAEMILLIDFEHAYSVIDKIR